MCEFAANASSVETFDEAAELPAALRLWITCRTLSDRILRGSDPDGLALAISLRRFEVIPDK